VSRTVSSSRIFFYYFCVLRLCKSCPVRISTLPRGIGDGHRPFVHRRIIILYYKPMWPYIFNHNNNIIYTKTTLGCGTRSRTHVFWPWPSYTHRHTHTHTHTPSVTSGTIRKSSNFSSSAPIHTTTADTRLYTPPLVHCSRLLRLSISLFLCVSHCTSPSVSVCAV